MAWVPWECKEEAMCNPSAFVLLKSMGCTCIDLKILVCVHRGEDRRLPVPGVAILMGAGGHGGDLGTTTQKREAP